MLRIRRPGVILPTSLAMWLAAQSVWAGPGVVMKDGRTIEGKIGVVAGVAINPMNEAAQAGNAPAVRPIMFLDDDMRRTFVPKQLVAKVQEGEGEPLVKIPVKQRVAAAGKQVAAIGQILGVTPFDAHGRRTFSFLVNSERVDVVQGITLITPRYTKVEGLAGTKPYIMDMRIATSSLSRETLRKVLSTALDMKNSDDRFTLVKLLLQMEQYQDAKKELEGIIADFPQEARLKNEVRAIRQLHSRRIIEEINARRKAGQHKLAYAMLEQFPTQDVAGEVLQQVRDMLREYQTSFDKAMQTLQEIETNLAGIGEPTLHRKAEAAMREIATDLSFNTMDRLADFVRLADDEKLSPEEKFALAASAWVLGSNEATPNLPVALSLYEARTLVRKYLAEPIKMKRAAILMELRGQEGASPRLVARMIAQMKPPVDPPAPMANFTDLYELQIAGFDKEPAVNYYVQLPPEYDPYRRYPAVVTLNGSGTTCSLQLDWWAGGIDELGGRQGQGTRHGYIVIAVDWAKSGQIQYEYSAREHAAVLGSLRDACRRFAIDTDRVFLSGHSMGGDAAWDIGLSHPDLWAGVIPIVAIADKYCSHYTRNASMVPLYAVSGELDGDKTVKNAPLFDKLLKQHPANDLTAVEYQGRGHEQFSDEIIKIFDWMGRRERNFFPKEFKTASMRQWDNYFWWLELSDFPPATMVDPINWPPTRGFHAAEISGTISTNSYNSIRVVTGAAQGSIWLSPDLIDFDKRVQISFNNKSVTIKGGFLSPDLAVILEDVRTRGERLHPFWVRVDSTGGPVASEPEKPVRGKAATAAKPTAAKKKAN